MTHAEPEAGAALSPNAARYNLRDYGGYATASSTCLKRGVLLRSGQLDHVLPADDGLLARLGVRKIIDLRSDSEIAATSSGAYAGFGGEIRIADREDGVIPHAIDGIVRLARPDQVVAKMIETYRLLPGSARFRQGLGLYFSALADSDGATLIHCFAGKDRTGLAVALFHLALGVHRDEAFADYLATNACGEERILVAMAGLRRQARAEASDAVLREAMGVRAEYLAAALAEIESQSESPAAWVKQVTGLSQNSLERIGERFAG